MANRDFLQTAMPDASPDKAPMLAQLNRQFGADTATNQGIVAGQMRDQTSPEIIESAHEAAVRAGDVGAVTTLKALAVDKNIKLGANEMLFNTTTGKSVVSNTAGEKIRAQIEQGKNDRDAANNASRDYKTDSVEASAQARIEALLSNSGSHGEFATKQAAGIAIGMSKEDAYAAAMGSKIPSVQQMTMSLINAGMVSPPKNSTPTQAADFYANLGKQLHDRFTVPTAPVASIATGANPPGQIQMPVGANRPPLSSFGK